MKERILRIPEVDVKRVVITGGPGTGKTSLILKLEELGYPVCYEQARAFIQKAHRSEGGVSPWTDLMAFSEKVLNARLDDYQKAQVGNFNFYDRGLPDALAYLHRDGKTLPDDWISLVMAYRYEPTVFIAPPWDEIFHKDEERLENFTELVDIHEHLVNTYDNLGYRLCELPLLSIEERIEFIIDELS